MATYDGFISYSHSADGRLAPALQAGLQRFAKPWWRRRALRVFRDQSGLTANPHLWASIEAALADSEWFVLLCSPDAAASPWVGREIEWWLPNRGTEKLLAVVTSGELIWDHKADRLDTDASTAVPPALAATLETEPRWIDLRFIDEDSVLDLRNPLFRASVADVAAPLRGVAKDELESEEVRQHRRTIRTAKAAATALVLLTAVAVLAGVVAVRQRDEAQAQRIEAETQRSEAVRQEAAAVAAASREQVERLSAQAGDLAAGRIDAALLLAVEASIRAPGPATDDVLLRAVADAGPIVGVGLLPKTEGTHFFDAKRRLVLSDGDELIRLVPGQVEVERLVPRPGQTIFSVQPVGDGDRVVVSYGDGDAQVLDVATGAVASERHLARPTVLVSLGEVFLGLVPGDSHVSVLSGDSLADIEEIDFPIDLVGVRAFGDVAMVAGFDGVVRAVDGVADPVELGALVRAVVFDASTGGYYAGLEDGRVLSWNFSAGSEPVTVAAFDSLSSVSALAISPDGRNLAVARDDGAALTVDLVSGERKSLVRSGEPIVEITFDGSGESIVAVSGSRWFRLRLDGRSALGHTIWSPLDPALFPDAVQWAEGRTYVAGPPGFVDVLTSEGQVEASMVIGDNAAVPSLTVADGTIVAAVVELPGVSLTQLKVLQAAARIDTPSGIDADFLDSILEASVVAVDPVEGERWRTPMPNAIVSVVHAADGRIVTLDTAGAISVLDPDTGEVLLVEDAALPTPGWRVVTTGDVVVATGQGLVTRGARLTLGALRLDGDLRNGQVSDAVDGSLLVSQRGSVGLADATTYDFTSPSAATSGREWDAKVVPDSDRIVLSNVSTLWFARGGRTVATFAVPAPIMEFVGAGPEQVVTMDLDGTVERWDISQTHLRGIACDLVGRDLTAEEWTEFFPDEAHRSTCDAASA